MSSAATKTLLELFRFPHHTAPGEAEAECAMLQKEGVVDAVLSEDVDTLMFGCTKSLRNWTAEGMRGNKEPTHVNLYDAEGVKSETALDCEGMILVALMSGGDYIPAGVKGCGVKSACEAAKAGFGKELCRIAQGECDGLKAWRERLQYEMRTNESKIFRQKHKAAVISESFPDMIVLRYYTHPAVSSPEQVEKLRTVLRWSADIDVPALRIFVGEYFDWKTIVGAKKFIRGLAPALLAHQMYRRSTSSDRDFETLEKKEVDEARLVRAICGCRTHWNTDGLPELRIAYIPADIAAVDLNAEIENDDQDPTPDVSDGEQADSDDDNQSNRSRSPTKRRAPSNYDPCAVEKIWVPETYAKLGVPVIVESWEEDMRNPNKVVSRKVRERKAVAQATMQVRAMDRFVKVSKRGLGVANLENIKSKTIEGSLAPPIFLAPATAQPSMSSSREILCENRKPVGEKVRKKNTVAKNNQCEQISKAATSATHQSISSPIESTSNPWSLSKRPSDTYNFKSSTRYSALGIYAPDDPESLKIRLEPQKHEDGASSSRHASPSPSPTPHKQRQPRLPTPLIDIDLSATNELRATDPASGFSAQKLIATPTRHNNSRPSPHKEQSLLNVSNELPTISSILTSKQHCTLPVETSKAPSTAQNINRSLDFTTTTPPAPVSPLPPASPASGLPSPSSLLAPRGAGALENAAEASASLPTVPVAGQETKCGRKYVALRESLEGAWKHLEPWEAEGLGKGVYAGVEVLDLTSY